MKRLLIILLCLILTACVSHKKMSQTVHVSDSTANVVQKHTSTDLSVNETTDEQTQTTVTEVEFYEPDSSDTSNVQTTIVITPSGEIIGSSNQGIKSIKQTTTSHKTEQTTQVQESTVQDTISSEVTASQADIETHTEKKSKPTHYQTAILIFVALTLGVLYLKRKPIVNFIKKILIGLVKAISKG